MNEFLPSRFSEEVKRLALGLEPVDAELGLRVPHRIQVTFDTDPLGLPRPPIDHHNTSRHVLLYSSKLLSPVDLRFFDTERRIVPRRLRIPILTLPAAESSPPDRRVRRPFLFPGAAYDVASGVTGVRGRVLRGGVPMRWSRVEAHLPAGGLLVGRAHGDDRGEFLLLIGSNAAPVGSLHPPLHVEITVFGPAAPPVPTSPGLPEIDPLWDLPLEQAAAPGAPDPVTSGELNPANYTASVTLAVDLTFGRIASPVTFTIL